MFEIRGRPSDLFALLLRSVPFPILLYGMEGSRVPNRGSPSPRGRGQVIVETLAALACHNIPTRLRNFAPGANLTLRAMAAVRESSNTVGESLDSTEHEVNSEYHVSLAITRLSRVPGLEPQGTKVQKYKG